MNEQPPIIPTKPKGFTIKLSTALIICFIIGLYLGYFLGAVIFFLGFGWFIVNKKGEKIF